MDSSVLAVLIPLVLGAAAIIWLMPSKRRKPRFVAGVLGLVAIFFLTRLTNASGDLPRDLMFDAFAAVALVSGALMVTDKNPAYSALWFALVTLAVCGLFFLQAAPFLAAATVIVYAGAIIVTFLFVLMLASQSGGSAYNQRPTHPILATVMSFALLGAVLWTLHLWNPDGTKTTPKGPAVAVASKAKDVKPTNLLSRPTSQPTGSLHELGRSLFGDYLYAVELAGTLLLIASIAAIAIAPRRSQGTL